MGQLAHTRILQQSPRWESFTLPSAHRRLMHRELKWRKYTVPTKEEDKMGRGNMTVRNKGRRKFL